MSEETKEGSVEIKGVPIKSIGYGILVVACLLFGLTIYGLVHVTEKYDELIQATNNYIVAESAIRQMEQASDYLTEQSRQYVVTMNREYVNAYFEEVNNNRGREVAVWKMQECMGDSDSEVCTLMEDIYEKSNALMELEIHSMKLISVLKGYDMDELPEEIGDFELTETELGYDQTQLQNCAYFLVFDKNYADKRLEIDDELEEAIKEISRELKAAQKQGGNELQAALVLQRLYIFFLFVLIIVIFVILSAFVLRPIRRNVVCIEKGEFLEEKGAYEIRYLAHIYNDIFKLNELGKQNLQHKAEHDALTGLWNRQAFEQLKGYLSESLQPLTLILVDVDTFKNVNDTYGHETGDRALKRVANLLKEHFRSNDYPIRIGGDEFAVLMTGTTPTDKEAIRKKINDINESLQKAEEDLPKLSVSAGVAFSQFGYNDELYTKADSALYQTKENGRCGYTFYNG